MHFKFGAIKSHQVNQKLFDSEAPSHNFGALYYIFFVPSLHIFRVRIEVVPEFVPDWTRWWLASTWRTTRSDDENDLQHNNNYDYTTMPNNKDRRGSMQPKFDDDDDNAVRSTRSGRMFNLAEDLISMFSENDEFYTVSAWIQVIEDNAEIFN